MSSTGTLITADLDIGLLTTGELIVKWNGDRHWLIGREAGMVARHRGRAIGYLLWEIFHPGDDCHPCSYRTTTFLYLYSAWTHPRMRGRGVFTALSQALLDRFRGLPVEGLSVDGDDCTVGRFFARAGAVRPR